MPNKRPKMTHAEHLEFSHRYRVFVEESWKIHEFLQMKFGKSHYVSRALLKVFHMLNIRIKSELDDEYHAVTTNLEFCRAGHVYYKPLPQREK